MQFRELLREIFSGPQKGSRKGSHQKTSKRPSVKTNLDNVRDGETTIKIKVCVFEGGAKRKAKKNAVFLGKRRDNKILKVQIVLSRNFVLVAQAPIMFDIFGAGTNVKSSKKCQTQVLTLFDNFHAAPIFWPLLGALKNTHKIPTVALGRAFSLEEPCVWHWGGSKVAICGACTSVRIADMSKSA